MFILCSLQTRLQPILVQTQGTQLLKVFIQLYYNNSHQQYENEVPPSSMFNNHNVVNHSLYKIGAQSQKHTLKQKEAQKDSWEVFTATGSESTEREQTPYSTHLNRVYFYK